MTLAIVEGEINSLSIAEAFPEWDVCSPGSASMFSADSLSKYLTQFKKYSKIIVILDNDKAGLKGLIECKAFFLYKLPFVNYILLDEDSNDCLVKYGKEGLRSRVLGSDIK